MIYVIKKRVFQYSDYADVPEPKILGIVQHIDYPKELEEKMIEIAKNEGIEKVDNFGFCEWTKCYRIGDWTKVELFAELTRIL